MKHRVDTSLDDPEERALNLELRADQYRIELPALRVRAEDLAVLYLRHEQTSERRGLWEEAERDVIACGSLIRRVRTLARQIKAGQAKQRSTGREDYEDADESIDEAVRVAMLARARRILRDHTLASTSVESLRQWRTARRRRERAAAKSNRARGRAVAGAAVRM